MVHREYAIHTPAVNDGTLSLTEVSVPAFVVSERVPQLTNGRINLPVGDHAVDQPDLPGFLRSESGLLPEERHLRSPSQPQLFDEPGPMV